MPLPSGGLRIDELADLGFLYSQRRIVTVCSFSESIVIVLPGPYCFVGRYELCRMNALLLNSILPHDLCMTGANSMI